MLKDIGFWNAKGKYIEDIQEIDDMEMKNADGSRNWEANILYDNIKRLEQENARLKKIIYGDANTIRPTFCVADEDYEKAIIGNAIYRKAFEEIRGIAKIENIPDIISPNDLATFYIERTQQLKKIQNKVNEVLQ